MVWKYMAMYFCACRVLHHQRCSCSYCYFRRAGKKTLSNNWPDNDRDRRVLREFLFFFVFYYAPHEMYFKKTLGRKEKAPSLSPKPQRPSKIAQLPVVLTLWGLSIAEKQTLLIGRHHHAQHLGMLVVSSNDAHKFQPYLSRVGQVREEIRVRSTCTIQQ